MATVSDLTGPGIEPKTSFADSDVFSHFSFVRSYHYFQQRRIFPSANETLEDFAKSSLIPDETADLYRNVKITEITKPNKNGTAKPANANPSSDTNNGLTSADDATSPHARQEDGKPKNTHESATAPTTTSSTEFQSSTSQRPPGKLGCSLLNQPKWSLLPGPHVQFLWAFGLRFLVLVCAS